MGQSRSMLPFPAHASLPSTPTCPPQDGVVHVVDLDLGALLRTAPVGDKQQQQNSKEQVQALSQEDPDAPTSNTTTLQMALPDGNTVVLTVSKMTKAGAAASSSRLLCAKPASGQGQELCLDQQQEEKAGGVVDVDAECETWAGQGVNGTDGSSGVFTRCGELHELFMIKHACLSTCIPVWLHGRTL